MVDDFYMAMQIEEAGLNLLSIKYIVYNRLIIC
jgi:hypothetical protein